MTSAAPPETDAERRVRQLAMLRRLTDTAMGLAQAAALRAMSAEPTYGEPDPIDTFIEMSEAVRESIELECQIAAEIAASRPTADEIDAERLRRMVTDATSLH